MYLHVFAVVRRLFKMGLKSVQRRLKTVRRLFHPLLVAMCAILKNGARSAKIVLIFRYSERNIEDFLCFSIISKVLHFSCKRIL